ncbi:hypothetical protein EJV47_21665 [Hymenobacter gummosus]|uniref:Lipoprotein n=1 Tax=Hymenobacter gummosus TaxID=1776032 RepID=A0A3S0JBH8_9BACT|nr:hypothetical protein [Hymenobacter gummosus]RTQ46560.1 hypothetical protein EJV47_21665 [Hymenobacter gummosus]
MPTYRLLWILLLYPLLSSCDRATPDQPAATPAYIFPRAPAVSDAQGRPHDSLTFYLPPVDSLYAYYPEDLPGSSRDARHDFLTHLSAELYYFGAPVLANVPQPGRTWRALRHSGFDYTTLFTVRETAPGRAQLRIQTLDRHPRIGGPTAPPPPPPVLRDAAGRLIPRDTSTTPEHRAYEAWARQPPQLVCDTTFALTAAQRQQVLRHFEQTLPAQSGVSNDIADCCDGASWLLEAQTPGQYRFWLHREGSSTQGLAGWLLQQGRRARCLPPE